jgi:hypothetical protein
MAQIGIHQHAVAGVRRAGDWVQSDSRVVRLDSTTYGVKDGDENRWHWVHRAPAQQRWTCGCAQGQRCRHIEQVLQKVRYRHLWRAI